MFVSLAAAKRLSKLLPIALSLLALTHVTSAIAQNFANRGFENPVQPAGPNGFTYRPGGGTWSFAGGSGIQRNGSDWSAAPAPEGQQTAFLQGGTISQTINLATGSYRISFKAARRGAQIQPLQLTVDGAAVGSPITPADATFALYTSDTFSVRTGDHTVQFATTNAAGDNSSFVDDVSIAPALVNDVEVLSLVIDTPPPPSATFAHMVLRNNGLTSVHVPWVLTAEVRNSGANFGVLQEVASSPALVPLGLSAPHSVWVPIPPALLQTASPATVTFTAEVDPSNTIGENPADRANNRKSYQITLSPQLETRELVPQLAEAAGATFVNNIESFSACYKLGVGNWKDNDWAPDRWFPGGGRKTGVLFVADCVGILPFGGRADPVAYGNFLLKNGWHVKSVDAPEVTGASGNANFSRLSLPAPGSIAPAVGMHVFATFGHFVRVGIRILIEGPAGTDPYGASGMACGVQHVPGQVNRYCSSSADCDSGSLCTACGECSQRAPETASCAPGQTNCAGICQDLDTDKNNCGACGNQCGIFWNNLGTAACAAGSCVNTLTDNQNCGTVGVVCPARPAFLGGTRPGSCVLGHCN